MIIPDLNLVLYAYSPGAASHIAARRWWETLLESGQSVGIAWVVIIGFIRLSTTRGILARPVTPVEALRRVEAWFDCSGVGLVVPGSRHLRFLHGT